MACNTSYLISDPIPFGSTPKFSLDILAGEQSMDDYDFCIRLQRGPNSVQIPKSAMVTDGEGGYYICVDTKLLGVGGVSAVVQADIPDTDYLDGVRVEMVKIEKFFLIVPV